MTAVASPPPTLAATGLALLSHLVEDGRASYQSLADQVGLSRPAVMERVKRLEELGVIRGYTALLDRGRIGRPITAFVTVRYPASDYVGTEPWILKLRENPDILECHHVAGEDCYILKVAVPTVERLQSVLRALRPKGEPATTKTTIVLSTVFEKVGVLPAETPEVPRGVAARPLARGLADRLLRLGLHLSRHPGRGVGAAAVPHGRGPFPGRRGTARRVRPAPGGEAPRRAPGVGGPGARRRAPALRGQRPRRLGRTVCRLGLRKHLRRHRSALVRRLRRRDSRRHHAILPPPRGRLHPGTPRKRGAGRGDPTPAARRRSSGAGVADPGERLVGSGLGLPQAAAHIGRLHHRRHGPDAGWRRGAPCGGVASRRAAPVALLPRRPRGAGVSDRRGIPRGLHRLRLRTPPRFGHGGGDLRLRQSGGRGPARMGYPGRAAEPAENRGDGRDPGRGALDPVGGPDRRAAGAAGRRRPSRGGRA